MCTQLALIMRVLQIFLAEIETTGRLLFLEDIGEQPYRIDRYLSQLRLAGKLDVAARIIPGYFTVNSGT